MKRLWGVALVFVSCQCSVPVTTDAGLLCDAGQLLCGVACIDPSVDNAHCGSCRHACDATASCAASACFANDCPDADCSAQAVCVDGSCTEKLCIGVDCPKGATCYHGTCQSESCGSQPCPPGSVCVADLCTDVACIGVVCPGDGFCVRGACQHADAGTCDAGATCAGNPDVCRLGTLGCNAGAPVCVDGPPLDAGTSCGAGRVCSAVGACLPCDAGASCSTNSGAPCVLGLTSCSSGAAACVDTGTTLAAGTSCGVDLVCGNDGGCAACTENQSCALNPNPCMAGASSCATGTFTCVDTATSLPDDTPCGAPGNTCLDGTCLGPPLNYYGTGDAGVVNTSGDLLLCDGTVDGPMCVMNFKALTLNQGHTLTTAVRRRGLLVYVDGDAVINGTLTMTARGAFADPLTLGVPAAGLQLARIIDGGTDTGASNLAGAGAEAVAAESAQVPLNGNGTLFSIAREGAAGGPAVSVGPCGGAGQQSPGPDGASGARQAGGGGSGAANCGPWGPASAGGAGAAGTCFSGGSAGGAGVQPSASGRGAAQAGAAAGGKGGDAAAFNNTGGGGAGNPGGAGDFGGPAGGSGTGGLLILVVRGHLTIGAHGLISADGVSGGGGAVAGGSSGGGNVLVLHAGPFSNEGDIRAAGGAAVGGVMGGKGGDGSVQIARIAR